MRDHEGKVKKYIPVKPVRMKPSTSTKIRIYTLHTIYISDLDAIQM